MIPCFLLLPLGLHGVGLASQVGQFLLDVLQPLPGSLVVFLLQGGLLDLQLHHPPGDLVQGGGHAVDLRAQPGAGLVHQVDGLVRQEAVGDVAVGQHRRRHQGGILDAHPVVHLVALLEAAQDGDGVLHRGRVDQHRLEAALQGGVLLDVLPVFVQGGGSDRPQLAAGQHRLQQVAGVHGALGRPGAHHRVQLVDEQHDPALRIADLLQHRLQALLELAAVLGARHQGTHVQGDDPLLLQSLGHVLGDDAPGEALHDGGLADAGFADQHRVVLGAAGEDLHHPPDLLVPADHRVELAVRRQPGQVAAIALQGLVGGLRVLAGDPLRAPDRLQGVQEAVPADILPVQQFFEIILALVDQGEQQVLHAQVLVLQGCRFLLRPGQHPGQPGAEVQRALGAVDRRDLAQ